VGRQGQVERAEVSRAINRQIAEMSGRLDADGSLEVRFLCECGCFSWVTMPAKLYADGGARHPDHVVPVPELLDDASALG
jgi:hypothetical protein